MIRFLNQFLVSISVLLIRIYQYTISPDKGVFSRFLRGRVCAHEPHCSEYTVQALRRFGFRSGRDKGIQRILHCTPSHTRRYDPVAYRVVFFSSAAIGVSFMKNLFEDKRFDLVGVVTMPDAPVGRGHKIQPNIIATTAHQLSPSLPVLKPMRLHPDKSDEGKSFFEDLQKIKPDVLVVIAYGKILPQVVLDLPKYGAINVHGSLLPKYRGASPLQSVFLNYEEKTGITIMKMSAGLDEGPLLDAFDIELNFFQTVKDLIDSIQTQGPSFLNTTLSRYLHGDIVPTPQDDAAATLCTKISKEDGIIDPFQDPLYQVYAKYRAFFLWPKVAFMIDNQRVIIESMDFDLGIYSRTSLDPLLQPDYTLNPALTSLRVKPENKSTRDWSVFVSSLSPKKHKKADL